MKKLKLFSKKLTIPLIIFGFLLVILFSLVTVILYQDYNQQNRSQVLISLEQNDLVLKFKIDPKDQSAVENLSQRLNVSTAWTEGITMSIDPENAQYLKNYLPQTAGIRFRDDRIEISNVKPWNFFQTGLQTALPDQDLEWATGSGRIKVQRTAQNNIKLNVENPEELLLVATTSGSLTVDSEFETQVWPVLTKFVRIEIEANSGLLKGLLLLR